MRRFVLVTAAVFTLCLTAGAHGGDPDPKEVLRKADAATKALTTVSYKAESYGAGANGDKMPRVKGEVMLEEIPDSPMCKLVLKGVAQIPGRAEPMDFNFITDGRDLIGIDTRQKKVTRGDAAAAVTMFGPSIQLFMREYVHPTPFSDEIGGDELKYEGTEKISGVECHKVYVKYAGGAGEARWWFSKDDSLPRRVDRLKTPVREGGSVDLVLVVSDLNVAPIYTADTFAPKTPEGFAEEKFNPRAARAAAEPGGPSIGQTAPTFTLKTPDGKTVSLESLKGKVVLIDFWAAWCSPCKASMPEIQKLHEKFKDKGLEVLGISAWPRGTDPVKYMTEQKFTYGLLMDGDSVAEAYKVDGLPTWFVIGRDGKIAGTGSGYKAGDETRMAEAIEAALAK